MLMFAQINILGLSPFLENLQPLAAHRSSRKEIVGRFFFHVHGATN
jgi:hypothetical protein